jgi:hypothetical protein
VLIHLLERDDQLRQPDTNPFNESSTKVKSPTSRERREKWGTGPSLAYGFTVRRTAALTMPFDDAVMLVVPAVSVEALPLASIVATAVLLESQRATELTSTEPLHVSAVAVKGTAVPWVTLGLVGDNVILVIQAAVTVTVV